MIKFINFTKTANFRYIWLKYVTDINLDRHCAKCLTGEYSKVIGAQKEIPPVLTLDEFAAPIVYLCGVSSPYNWDRNVHLALRESATGKFTFSQNGIEVIVENAEQLPITEKAMNALNHPRIGSVAYRTCRSWQFANYLQQNPRLLHMSPIAP